MSDNVGNETYMNEGSLLKVEQADQQPVTPQPVISQQPLLQTSPNLPPVLPTNDILTNHKNLIDQLTNRVGNIETRVIASLGNVVARVDNIIPMLQTAHSSIGGVVEMGSKLLMDLSTLGKDVGQTGNDVVHFDIPDTVSDVTRDIADIKQLIADIQLEIANVKSVVATLQGTIGGK